MRNRIIKINLIIAILLALNFIFLGCYNQNSDNNSLKEDSSGIEYKEEVFNKSIENLNAWIAYWSLDVDDEIKYLGSQLSELSYFEAYFDVNGNIHMPEELLDYYNKSRRDNYTNYISIVNDKININEKIKQKDTEILKEKLKDELSRSSHIDEIINLALSNNFDGIEIDYEQIKKDIPLWQDYIMFIDELYNKANENNLKLRIILEPSIPIEELEFIEGPVYVIMCYNLHTASSAPGEKANVNFINDLMNKMEKIPGEKNYAIATGGFDWEIGGKGKAISEKDAKELLKEYDTERRRDQNSKCVVFNYTDENNIKHEVWYADNVTLNVWMEAIHKRGYSISIWKLGGNLFE
ncbi:MAG: glycosyl hydrolase [Clostridium butyricum]|nr:glycosyl hydrolase [Clostridium butyricum]